MTIQDMKNVFNQQCKQNEDELGENWRYYLEL